jgi:MFS transporter, DHA3 family, multidrug efflux protein
VTNGRDESAEAAEAAVSQAATPAPRSGVSPPPNGMRTFLQVLANTMIANVTTSFLWFALTFWVYL